MWNPMAVNTQGKDGEDVIFDIMRESTIEKAFWNLKEEKNGIVTWI